MHRFFLFFILLLYAPLSGSVPSHFCKQLSKAKRGDYIVTVQPGSYGVLTVVDKKEHVLTLEEIDVPDYSINLSTVDWKKWVTSGAPAHSSWTQFQINLQTEQLLEAKSKPHNVVLRLSKEDLLLFRLLSLPMHLIPFEERRKIGPPPPTGEEDHRTLWHPPLVFNKKTRKAQASVYRALWPKDKGPLSNSKVDLFFDDLIPDFPFPIWIEIYGGHFKGRLRIIEAGEHLYRLDES